MMGSVFDTAILGERIQNSFSQTVFVKELGFPESGKPNQIKCRGQDSNLHKPELTRP